MVRVFSFHSKLTRSIASHVGKNVRNLASNRLPFTAGDCSGGRPSHRDAVNDDNKTLRNFSAKLGKRLEKVNKAALNNVTLSQGTTDTTAEEIREIVFTDSSSIVSNKTLLTGNTLKGNIDYLIFLLQLITKIFIIAFVVIF